VTWRNPPKLPDALQLCAALVTTMASEEELKRREDEARVRAILEPKDEEARAKLREKQRQEEERRMAEADAQRTRRIGTLLLVALLATALFALLRWMLSDG
jgi:hypothetical protein